MASNKPFFLSILLSLYPLLLYGNMIQTDSIVDDGNYSLRLRVKETTYSCNRGSTDQQRPRAFKNYFIVCYDREPPWPLSPSDPLSCLIAEQCFANDLKMNKGVKMKEGVVSTSSAWMEKKLIVNNRSSAARDDRFTRRRNFSDTVSVTCSASEVHLDLDRHSYYYPRQDPDSSDSIGFGRLCIIIIAGASSFGFVFFFTRFLWQRRSRNRANSNSEEEVGYTVRQGDKSKLQIPEKALNENDHSQPIVDGVNVINLQFDSEEAPRNAFRDSAINTIKN
ncbi:hypothetical protein QJS10_CPA01g03026 [Acorus calamus]|uniref:Uncharacterized protein n=1 Tax=Acorus calamus TaxID=4465 RepID=A0AAV9FLH4_ACOCL|nr:hypothetical protein QJS10_CPA01g03026 [Acorus calamus]